MQQFNFPTTIYYGEGSLEALAQKVKERAHRKVLIVTDATLVELGVSGRLVQVLHDASIPFELFPDTQPNPTDDDVVRGKEAYLSAGCDSLIALGGGSPMDTAKVIKIAVSHPGPLSQYDEAKGGDGLVTGPMPSLYAVPTTAGTGSEVGRSGLIVMRGTGAKTIFFHPGLMPDVAVLEPELTAGMPPHITAATGMDAFIHSLEAYLVRAFHPLADGIALEGMRLVIRNLPVAVENGADLDARGKMLIAASMGATAFQKGLGVIHSLAHPLSAEYDMHHGLGCALMTAPSVRFIEGSDLDEDQERRLFLVNHLFSGTDYRKACLSETMECFIASLGIQATLAESGVKEGDLERLATAAECDPCHRTNTVAVGRDDFLRIYRGTI